MNILYYKNVLLIFIFISLIFYSFLLKNAFCIQFFDGIPTIVKDINNPNEKFFGGSNSNKSLIETGPTNLTITTQNIPRNTIGNIYGGGRSSNKKSNTVKGDITRTVNNTDAHSLFGGSRSKKEPVYITGSIYINITNSNFTTSLYGGSTGSETLVGGSINMILERITTPLLYGAGEAIGIGNKCAAVNGDINITMNNSAVSDLYLVSGARNINVNGNATLNITNSVIDKVGVGDSIVFGNVTMNIGQGTLVTNTIAPITLNAGSGKNRLLMIGGITNINIDRATVQGVVYLGPTGNHTQLNTINLDVTNSTINKIQCGPHQNTSLLKTGTVTINSGSVQTIQLGSDHGTTTTAIANIKGGIIDTLILGALQNSGEVHTAIANISCGQINNIYTGIADYTEINFLPGCISKIKNQINGLAPVDFINIQTGASTRWGTAGNICEVWAKHIKITGDLRVAPGSTVRIKVNELLHLDGGRVIAEGLETGNEQPILNIFGESGSATSVQYPLLVDLAYSPSTNPGGGSGSGNGGETPILIAKVEGIPGSDIFALQNRFSILWSNAFFDEETGTWYLTNIRPSQDFYSFSAAREATNWLRQKYLYSIQRRSNILFLKGHDGLWIDFQGGKEHVDVAIGTAKMPWIMGSMGYDHIDTLPKFYDMKTLYGFALGVTKGNDKWHTVNTTKNDIIMGIAAGYAGLMHKSGIYGTLTLQLAASRIHTKCEGFEANYKWTEIIPTEAIEIGWQYDFQNGFIITPRGQIIFEQLAKHTFDLSKSNESIILDRDFLTSTALGIAGQYDLPFSIPMNLQLGVDWIRGLSGDFAAKSQILKIKFKDKNNSNSTRITLALLSQLKENFDIHCNIFGDIGNDHGFGGQLGVTYTF